MGKVLGARDVGMLLAKVAGAKPLWSRESWNKISQAPNVWQSLHKAGLGWLSPRWISLSQAMELVGSVESCWKFFLFAMSAQ